MKTSGNGTPFPQWLYLQIFVPHVWRCKCGISGNVKRRTKQTSDKMPGTAKTIFAIWIPFAYQTEQFMHRAFKPFNTRFSNSGKECYYSIVVPFMFAFMLLVLAFWLAVLFFGAMGLSYCAKYI